MSCHRSLLETPAVRGSPAACMCKVTTEQAHWEGTSVSPPLPFPHCPGSAAAAVLPSFSHSSAFSCLVFILPCDTIFSMETSDKVTDKCSSQFCRQLPFQIHEARETAPHPHQLPLPHSSQALSQGPLGMGISPLPLCPPAHSQSKESSVLPAVPVWGLYLSRATP